MHRCGYLSLIVLVLGLALTPAASAQDFRCARIDDRQGYGPYDYRDKGATNMDRIRLVETAHFTLAIQRAALDGLPKETFVWANLDYTLRAFPNHNRALYLLAVWEQAVARSHGEMLRALRAKEHYAPVPCYFQRAIRYAPKDVNVYNALGRAQHRLGQLDEAIESFKKVVSIAPRSAQAHYNLGLAYFAAEKYEESVAAARKAYSLGYKRNELKARLIRKGHWK